MSIAQRFVAGEVSTQACDSKIYPASPGDSHAIQAYACDTTNLPWVIFRAAFRAAHLAGISQRSRSLLSALARTVDADKPYASIFARRELLTDRAMQSMRTLYRGLNDLVDAGLIIREPQRRYGEAGLYGRAYLHLTEPAATLLGFVDTPSVVAKPPAEESTTLPPETHMATLPDTPAESKYADIPLVVIDAPEVAVNTPLQGSALPLEISKATPSDTLADRAIYKDLFPTSQKRQQGKLPEDLNRLLSLGFNENFVLKLMGQARREGKFLSTIVDVCWKNLKSSAYPISYLQALIKSQSDFQALAQHKADEAMEQERLTASKHNDEKCRMKLAGATFFSANGRRRHEISHDGVVITTLDSVDGRLSSHAGHWPDDFMKALAAGHVVPSTADLTQRFTATLNARPTPLSQHKAAGEGEGIKDGIENPQVPARTRISDCLAMLKAALYPIVAG